jgi:hypothetical protein
VGSEGSESKVPTEEASVTELAYSWSRGRSSWKAEGISKNSMVELVGDKGGEGQGLSEQGKVLGAGAGVPVTRASWDYLRERHRQLRYMASWQNYHWGGIRWGAGAGKSRGSIAEAFDIISQAGNGAEESVDSLVLQV